MPLGHQVYIVIFLDCCIQMTRHPSITSLEQLMASAPSTEYNLYLYSIALILSYFALEYFIGDSDNISNVQTLAWCFHFYVFLRMKSMSACACFYLLNPVRSCIDVFFRQRFNFTEVSSKTFCTRFSLISVLLLGKKQVQNHLIQKAIWFQRKLPLPEEKKTQDLFGNETEMAKRKYYLEQCLLL